jgi:hypothetical protein
MYLQLLIGWRKYKEIVEKISEFTSPPSERTLYRVIQNEMNWFENEDPRALRSKPDIAALEREVQCAKEKLSSITNQPDFNESKYVFSPTWYEKLKQSLLEHQNTVGFGPLIVQSEARRISGESTAGIEEFIPSEQWCRWFLRIQMGFVVRRKTSHRYTPQQEEKQRQIHQRNLERLALLKATKGLLDADIIGADEVGCFFFPNENEIWVKRGSKEVCSSVKDDKRQFTGNIICNAAGDIVAFHQIFEGGTDASLPSLEIRKDYAKITT